MIIMKMSQCKMMSRKKGKKNQVSKHIISDTDDDDDDDYYDNDNISYQNWT